MVISALAGDPHADPSTPEAPMTNTKRLARRERLALARAALTGLVAGAARALLDWLINIFTA